MPDLRRIMSQCSFDPFCRVLVEMAHNAAEPLYLVGGAVRDIVMGRQIRDWDFAGTAATQFAEQFAARMNSRPVMLHEDQPTVRVPVRGDPGEPYLLFDFCRLRAETIQQDLAARDFSINAIAYNLRRPELMDPCGGMEDIRSGTIRALGPQNLQADPLRCLRAYRLAAELGFAIHEQTRQWIRLYAAELGGIPGQRIGDELHKLLYPPRVAETLALMDEDGVLAVILPELEEGRDMPQPAFHHLDVRSHILASVSEMERLILDPVGALPASLDELEQYLTRSDVPPMLLMAALLHDIGKPRCFTRDPDRRIRFKGHGDVGAEMARDILSRFAWPAEIRRTVAAFTRHHLRPFMLADPGQDGVIEDERSESFVTMSAIRRLFREVAPHEIGFLLLAIADSRASRGPAVTDRYQVEVELILDDMLRRYLQYMREQARPPLLTGQDLLDAGYQPGPVFSEILRAVEDARADGQISTRQQALDLARDIARRHGITPR